VTVAWPWIVIAGLGAFHGLNPAMGWLFAVAIGLQRDSFRAVLLSLLPIAAGHAFAVLAAILLFLLAGLVFDQTRLRWIAGLLLIGWALWHLFRGHRTRVRFGMTAGMIGLAAWSFLMALAHGAGLMLFPALLPLCMPETGGTGSIMGSTGLALAAVALHSATMLAVAGTVAVIVYRLTGVAILREGWINLDWLWSAALIVSGIILIVWQ
jgi:hypothetical protein